MNVVSYASLVFLIVCMFTCSFVVDRYVKRSHDDDDLPVLPSVVIFLNMLVSVVVAFINLEWRQPVSLSAINVFLAVANFMISPLYLASLSKAMRSSIPRYAVHRITGSGFGAVIVSEQDFRNRAIYDALQLAKKNTDDVFVVVDVRGNQIATINHSDVSIQMHS